MVRSRAATFSPCLRYRYSLRRQWEADPVSHVLWVLLNPSTADERRDDATVRKCVGFSRRWGYGALAIVNLYAWRSTDPSVLPYVEDPVGPDNDATILREALEATEVVLAWGGACINRERVIRVIEILIGATFLLDVDLLCLGLTQAGAPRHPVRLAYNTELVPYSQVLDRHRQVTG